MRRISSSPSTIPIKRRAERGGVLARGALGGAPPSPALPSLLETWLRRRATVTAVLLILVVLVAASLPSLQFGPSRTVGAPVFSVSIDWFGVDAEEMERQVTVPLEDAVSNLAGMQRLRATSEYGRSIVEVTLSPTTAPDKFYLALRDAVNTMYGSLPRSVQRPEIQSTSSSQRPFFIATVTAAGETLDRTRELVEKSIKPALERVDGVGDLEVGGGSQREVHVVVDQKKAATAGLSFNAIASALQGQYLSRPIGRLRRTGTDTPIILDGRIGTLNELADLRIDPGNGRPLRLGDVAEVGYGGREPDAISRIDQARRVTLYIKAAGTANVVAVSRALHRKLAELSSAALGFDVVYDLGADIAASIAEVLRSLAVAAGIVSVFVGLVLRPLRNAVLLALLLPFVVLATAALLAALGLSIDHNILAGIGVGIGMIVDPGIIMLSALVGASARSAREGAAATVRELASPLVASVATIVIVLAPLLYMGRSVSGLAEVSSSLAIMLALSLGMAVLFIPVFAGRLPRAPVAAARSARRRRAGRAARRALDRVVAWTGGHAAVVLPLTAAVIAAGVIAAFRMDLVLAPAADPHSIYAHVEFASGTTIETIDRRTAWLARQVGGMPGVKHVQTIARRESSEMTITTTGSARETGEVRSALAALGRELSDAFVYLPEGETGHDQSIEVSLSGPDNETLRATAKRAAEVLRGAPWVSQVVLNFKEGPPAWLLSVNHDMVSDYGLSTTAIANTLRWSMYGPVALKWFEPDSREIDLRVRGRGDERGDLPAVLRTAILGTRGRVVSVSQLGLFRLTQPPSRIFRADRQRAVYFTVHSAVRNTATVLASLEATLAGIPLASGYAFRVDREVYDSLARFRTLTLLLGAALFLIFITLATQMESLSTPLLVMSIVPVSLSVPLAFLWIIRASIDVPVIVSLIIMTGIIVNNAILVLDRTLRRCGKLSIWSAAEVRRSLRYAVRARTRALFLTSATTALGVVPFLFGASTGSELFRPLALVVLWGTAVSVSATFLVLPAVVAVAPVFARRFPVVRR